MIIHLNGWPGAGKKTIGQIVAKRLEARFIHNHLLHDVAIVCTGVTGTERWELYETVRAAAFGALAKRPKSETFVMTNALCKNSTREQWAWRHVVELAVTRQVPLIPIVLTLDAEENLRRVQSADRIGKKMTDPETLQQWFQADSIQVPDVPELLMLDVTPLSPEQAAEAICAHVAGLRGTVQTASLQHLHMK